ncbi:unnamed protein product [Phytomonas sp. Hart1]|nr:unnamed protein product [Phytomonas sp. Hart1]|eukprot:CCW70013.1 unnamed protein product [Phytomonas sp. isolate Hart1]
MRFTSAEDIGMRTLDIFLNNTEEGPDEFVSQFTTLTNAKKASLVDEILRTSALRDGCEDKGSGTADSGGVPMVNTENISNELQNPKERNVFLTANFLNMPRPSDAEAIQTSVSCTNDICDSVITAGNQSVVNNNIECIDLDEFEEVNAGNLSLCFSNTADVIFPTKFDNFFTNTNSADMDNRAARTELVVPTMWSKSSLSSLPSLDDFLSVEDKEKVFRAPSESQTGLRTLALESLSINGKCRRKSLTGVESDDTSSNLQNNCISRSEGDMDFDLFFPGLTKDEHCMPNHADGVKKIENEDTLPCLLSDRWFGMLKDVIVEPDDCVHPFVLSVDLEYNGDSLPKAV